MEKPNTSILHFVDLLPSFAATGDALCLESLSLHSPHFTLFVVLPADAEIQKNGLDSPVSSTGQAMSSTECHSILCCLRWSGPSSFYLPPLWNCYIDMKSAHLEIAFSGFVLYAFWHLLPRLRLRSHVGKTLSPTSDRPNPPYSPFSKGGYRIKSSPL